jgi:hypothetical protein
VQVESIKPVLIPPGIKRLKLAYDKLVSNFAFNANLRRYNAVAEARAAEGLSVDFTMDSPATPERVRMACEGRLTAPFYAPGQECYRAKLTC